MKRQSDTGNNWSIRTYEYTRPDGVLVGEKYKYQPPSVPRGGEKKKKTLRDKARDKSARGEYELNRMLTANFTTEDKAMVFTLSNESISDINGRVAVGDDIDANTRLEAVRQEFLKTVRRVQAKNKRRLRERVDYIFVVSDMDGETGEVERVHIHAVVRAAVSELFAECWTLGLTKTRALFHDGEERDFFTYARYLIRQVRYIPGKRQFYGSKNLTAPKPVTLTNRRAGELTKPRGAEIINREAYEKGASQHMRYWYPNGKSSRRRRE